MMTTSMPLGGIQTWNPNKREVVKTHALFCPVAFNCLLSICGKGDRLCRTISVVPPGPDTLTKLLVAMWIPPPKITQLFKLSVATHCTVELIISIM
jgi:hypothetical protein